MKTGMYPCFHTFSLTLVNFCTQKEIILKIYQMNTDVEKEYLICYLKTCQL